jgi:hypothetical protein
MEFQAGLDPAGRRTEREWMVPSAVMTVLLGAAAIALMPAAGYSSPPPYFGRFINWMVYCVIGAMLLLAANVVRLMLAGVERPIAHLKHQLQSRWGFMLAAVAGVMLAQVDMLFFMWIKPELNAVAPFWADPLFADVDRAIFGRDPWLFFHGMDLSIHDSAYSFVWMLAIAGTVLWLFAQRPSKERTSSIISYFAIWSLFGPIGQLAGSAAGPVFYRRIGLGDRFLGLEQGIPDVTKRVANYLWDFHQSGLPAVGNGISAMPSLHIATAAWIFIVFRIHRSKVAPLAAIFALYMLVMSVALGWHYAIDGIAGALGAFACQWLSAAWLRSAGQVAVKHGSGVALSRKARNAVNVRR